MVMTLTAEVGFSYLFSDDRFQLLFVCQTMIAHFRLGHIAAEILPLLGQRLSVKHDGLSDKMTELRDHIIVTIAFIEDLESSPLVDGEKTQKETDKVMEVSWARPR